MKDDIVDELRRELAVADGVCLTRVSHASQPNAITLGTRRNG